MFPAPKNPQRSGPLIPAAILKVFNSQFKYIYSSLYSHVFWRLHLTDAEYDLENIT